MINISNQLKREEFRFIKLNGKVPIEKEWQTKNNYKFNDPILIEWLSKNNNYGIVCGYGNLIGIDFDNKEFQDKYYPLLPKTFTIKSGSGNYHLYYFCDKFINVKINNKMDIQSNAKQLVGCGSTHPNGNKYVIENDLPISDITFNLIEEIFKEYIFKIDESPSNKLDVGKIIGGVQHGGRNDVAFKLACRYKSKRIDKSETLMILTKWNEQNKPPLPNIEIERCIDSAYKYPDNNINVSLKLDNYKENVERIFESQPFFYDENCNYWLWDELNYSWRIVDELDMTLMIEQSLSIYGSLVNSHIRSSYHEAIKEVGRTKKPKELDKDSIQFKDTIFNVKTKTTMKATPEYFCVNPINWKLGLNEDTPVMDKLFKEWVGEENTKILYEILAYCCLPNYPIHKMFCFIGSGCNGKSQFLNVINKFVGKNNISSTELDTLLDSRFESVKLYKKLVCVMGETNFGVLSKTSLLKRLSGQDLIGFEFKGKKPFDDYNYAKILISTNSLPVSNDESDGFFRRWLIIDFPNRFAEGKEVYLDIPDIEFENLTLKITNLLPKVIETGHFTNEGDIEQRKKKYIMASNPLPFFISHCCNLSESSYIKTNVFYNAFKSFLRHFKRRVPKRKEFYELLAGEGLFSEKTSKGYAEEYTNGFFIDGIDLKFEHEKIYDKCDKYDKFLTPLPYIGNEGKILSFLSFKSFNSEKGGEIEEIDFSKGNEGV